jgi:hypothetical protein
LGFIGPAYEGESINWLNNRSIPFFDYFESAYTLSEEVADEALWDYINNLEGGLLNNSWIIN